MGKLFDLGKTNDLLETELQSKKNMEENRNDLDSNRFSYKKGLFEVSVNKLYRNSDDKPLNNNKTIVCNSNQCAYHKNGFSSIKMSVRMDNANGFNSNEQDNDDIPWYLRELGDDINSFDSDNNKNSSKHL